MVEMEVTHKLHVELFYRIVSYNNTIYDTIEEFNVYRRPLTETE